MTNAERQKRYRAKKRTVPIPTGESVSFDPHGVTQTVTQVDESVTRVTSNPNVTATVTPGGVSTIRTASLEDYKTNPDDYANRAKPELLNWGPWMSADELSKAGLIANRVAVEGDWDYDGVGHGH